MANNHIKFSNVTPPCKDCKNRVVGCHSKCEKYHKYREEVDNANDMRRQKQIVESYGVSSKRK